MAKFKVVVTHTGYSTFKYEEEQLKTVDAELVITKCETEEDVIKACIDADGILVRLEPISSYVINSLKKCKVIVRYGVGYDNVDIKAATEKGICVANVPDYCLEEVAEHTLALLLSCTRKTVSHDKKIREGIWDIGASDPIYRMQGKTLGVIGFGHIAKTFLKKVKGFEFKILVFDPYIEANIIENLNAKKVTLSILLTNSDFISIHAPLNKQTFHLIKEKELRQMKKTAILINTSRGAIIDEEALFKALKERWINSAGIDVYEKEPPLKNSPLFTLENIVLTDHASWYSEDSIVELQTKAGQEVARVLTGKLPLSLVNPEVKDKLLI